jgi:hypothetical protein
VPVSSAQDTPPLSEASETCLACHESLHPGIVSGWRSSRHAAPTPAVAREPEGLALPTALDGIPASEFLIDAQEQSKRRAEM